MDASDDDDAAAVLSALRRAARGDDVQGRDEVPGGFVVRLGGDGSRALALEVDAEPNTAAERRMTLRADGGEVSAVFRTKGEWIFSHGDARFDAPDRLRGGKFLDALARWLGTPLGKTATDATAPPEPMVGSYVRLGVARDGDGIEWERLKLFFGRAEDDHCELFLSIATDGKRARLSEKWSRYRQPLLRSFDRAIGWAREPSNRNGVVCGQSARFSVPPDWLVSPQDGHVRVTDARDECCLEVSCLPAPRLAPGLPLLPDRLRRVLVDVGHEEALARIVSADRGDMDLVWAEYEHASDDPHRGVSRPARHRVLLAANDDVQVLATFAYWVDDAAWAVPEWTRIIETLDLGAAQGPASPTSAAAPSTPAR